jgi:hypothetical protein
MKIVHLHPNPLFEVPRQRQLLLMCRELRPYPTIELPVREPTAANRSHTIVNRVDVPQRQPIVAAIDDESNARRIVARSTARPRTGEDVVLTGRRSAHVAVQEFVELQHSAS